MAIALPLPMNGKWPTLTVVAGFLRARLGQPDRGDLRPAIGAARNVPGIHRMHVVQAGDLLDADHALMARLVREPGRAGEVADRVDPGLAGAAEFVDHDMGAVDFDAGAFQADPFDIADDADGGNHAIDGDVLRLAAGFHGDRDAVGGFLHALHGGAGQDLHALLLERLVGEGGNFLVLDRQDARQHLDHRHLGAQIEVEAGELDADRAGADHQQRFRHRGRHHRFAIGPDQLAVASIPGNWRARAPVARMMCGDFRVATGLPSFSTASVACRRVWPVPSNTVILFLRIRCATPEEIVSPPRASVSRSCRYRTTA
jgi:hypothetical protein